MTKITAKGVLRSNLAHNLRAHRIAAGLSQEELSELSGLDQTYVSYLETRRRNVSLDSVEILAQALSVDPLELLSSPPPEVLAAAKVLPQRALKSARQALRGAKRSTSDKKRSS
jgi:transcriptional regulator with XRE-family HTH domain